MDADTNGDLGHVRLLLPNSNKNWFGEELSSDKYWKYRYLWDCINAITVTGGASSFCIGCKGLYIIGY